MARPRLIVGPLLAFLVIIGVPSVQARSSQLGVEVPSQAQPGFSTAIEVRLPAKVGAVDGRLLFDGAALEAIGVAPAGDGSAFAPQSIQGGIAFGAYGLKPSNGATTLRLIVVPLVAGNIGVRVVIDAAANQAGRRLSLARRAGSATVSSGSGSTYAAPAAGPSPTPARAGGATRTMTGHVTLMVQDLDVARAAWEEAHLNSAVCGTLLDPAADANGDGCIDIVDVQAVAAAQHATAAPNPSVATVSAQTLARASIQRDSAVSKPAAAALAYSATFVVTSTSDTADANPGDGVCADSRGRCTLRAAITETNWSNGPDLIQFNINGSAPVRISLTSYLPHLMDRTGGVTIDGYSQPGSRVNTAQYGSNAIPGIELVGTSNSPKTNIFYIKSAGNVVRGFALNNAYRPISIQGADAHDNRIIGNWFGFTGSGAISSYGANIDLYLDGGPTNNIIGTPDLADRNVLGNATKAIDHYGPGTAYNVIQNNVLCMTPSGARSTCSTGIDHDFGPKNGLIGGMGTNERNYIGPTLLNGVEYSHGWEPGTHSNDVATWHVDDNRVIGNWIGFRMDGHYDASYRSGLNNPGNADNGNAVNAYDGANHNLIAGNYLASAYDGVNTMYDNATGNIIRDNTIGESVYGEAAPMAWWGVHVRYSTTDHQIIGNTIRNATRGGVGLAIPPNGSAGGERRILISRNIITDTTGPAIYLTPISSGAAAPGSNNMFPAPVITSATTVQVSGTGVAGSTVEVYRASRPAGQSGLPVAYLGSGTVAVDGTWSVPVTVSTGDEVTALEIATNNNTSMLGSNVTATFQAPPPAPVASFDWSQQAGGRTVDFTDTSTNTPTSWSWDFGDGGSSTDKNPSHTYATAGNYSVQLTASNGGGSDSFTTTVSVTDPAVTTYAADAFGRNVSNGWGTADLGGAYTLTGTAGNFSVSAGASTMVLPSAGALRSALLAGVNAQDVDITVRVSTDTLPVGGAYWVYLVARRNGTNEYRPKIHVSANGSVAVHAGRVINNAESSIAPEVNVAGLSATANGYIWVRAQVVGSGPTTIRVKAWADGQAEPANWQFSATDSSAALQGAGSTGLRAYLGGSVSNAPLAFRFDDYSVIAP